MSDPPFAMNTPSYLRRRCLLIALSSLLVLPGPLFPQGPLAPPPGMPAPTMKSLDQVEARTVINALNAPGDSTNQFIISQPGSYYLTGNITGMSGRSGINITANNVQIDLNGFSLVGVAGSLFGIAVPAPISNLTVRNGVVRDWGSEGLSAYNAVNSRFKEIRAYGNSVWGMVIGVGSGIDSCQAFSNGAGSTVGGGIFARFSSAISNCVAEGNTTHGIYTEDGCTISGCTAGDTALGGTANGQGIICGLGCSITGCSARSNAGDGITISNEGMVNFCAVSNNLNGIAAGNNCSISNCTASGNRRAGVATGSGCMITSCAASGNAKLFGSNFDAGIRAGAGSVISLCATSGNQLGGIYAADSTLISRCSSVANMTAGIFVQGAWTVQDCLVVGNAAGIAMDGGANRIDGNNVARSSPYPDIGSSASLSTSGQTVIIRNSVSKSILATSGVDIAPQGAAATVVSSWANLKQP